MKYEVSKGDRRNIEKRGEELSANEVYLKQTELKKL